MPTLTDKKFLDYDGISHLVAWILDNYPNNTDVQTIVDSIQDVLDEKEDITNLGTLAYANAADGEYTPEGSVSTPIITVTPSTTTINGITGVGTLPTWSASVDDSTETLSFSFSQGTLPTQGTSTTVVTGIQSATATQPVFTGTQASIVVEV